MQSGKDRAKTSRKCVLLIGDSGAGKTTVASTFPDPYFADFDNGLDSVPHTDYHYDSFFDEPDEDPTAAPRLWEEIKEWRVKPKAETFVLDSVTFAAEAVLRYILNKNGHGNKATIADWGEAIDRMKKILGYITTLRCNVVVNAHYQIHRDELRGGLYFVPSIYGKELPMIMPTFFNDVWRPFIAEDEVGGKTIYQYKMQIRPSTSYTSLKTTLPASLGTVVEPDYRLIVPGGTDEAGDE